jgi:mono/diheme cytochrome c family protein
MKIQDLALAASFAALLTAGAFASQSGPKTARDGVFSSEQSKKGKAHYVENCAGCHMEDLSGGGPAPSLTGDAFLAQNSERSIADLFTRIKTTMPPDRPEQLDDATYVEVIAYLLQEAGFPAGPSPLPVEMNAMKQIRILPAKPGKE